MEKKITKREKYEALLKIEEVAKNDMLVDFINHEIELLAKKNVAKSGKATAAQALNEEIKAVMLDNMEDKKEYTVTDIMRAVQHLFPDIVISNQKATALVGQLEKEHRVERRVDKRRALFTKVYED